MIHRRIFVAAGRFAACAILAAGCTLLAPRPDLARFYVLTPISEAGANSTVMTMSNAANQVSVGLGPIKFPAYLDRSQVVIRAAPNRLELSETERWAGPVDKNFSQVLAENLSALLGTQQIVAYPWYRTTHIDYQVRIEVNRFEGTAEGTSQLDARWEVTDETGAKILYARNTALSEPLKAGEPAAGAAALSRSLGALSREIASAIEQLQTQQGPKQAGTNGSPQRSAG